MPAWPAERERERGKSCQMAFVNQVRRFFKSFLFNSLTYKSSPSRKGKDLILEHFPGKENSFFFLFFLISSSRVRNDGCPIRHVWNSNKYRRTLGQHVAHHQCRYLQHREKKLVATKKYARERDGSSSQLQLCQWFTDMTTTGQVVPL